MSVGSRSETATWIQIRHIRPKNVVHVAAAAATATTHIANAIKNNTTHRKFGLTNRRGTCHGCGLVFCMGGRGDITTASKRPQTRVSVTCELRAGYAKPHVDHPMSV